MKLLFDESMPRPLGAYFPRSFEILTVQRMGWMGRSPGDLLLLLPVIVLIASRTRTQELQSLVSRVVDVVSGDLRRRIYRVSD